MQCNANRCYYAFNRQLSGRDLSCTTKQILYKTLILPVFLYGAEAWTLLRTDEAALRVFGGKVLKVLIFGPVRVGEDSRSRSIYIDVVQRINPACALT